MLMQLRYHTTSINLMHNHKGNIKQVSKIKDKDHWLNAPGLALIPS
jgi:hypothetical protein